MTINDAAAPDEVYDPDGPLPDLQLLGDGGVAALADDERIALAKRALYDGERLLLEVRAANELLACLAGVSPEDVDAVIDRAERDDAADAEAHA